MSRRVSPLAGFQVIIYGRFWVITEVLIYHVRVHISWNRRKWYEVTVTRRFADECSTKQSCRNEQPTLWLLLPVRPASVIQ
jgi:hypothetical protein